MTEFLNGLDIFSPLVILFRLLAATLSGFLIGYERERLNQPAGLRTHMVLSLGAASVMILSIYLPMSFISKGTNADPGRLAAQVISGIGFLGAGAIFRFGLNVKGLTSAASIWTTSGIGLIFGAGFYILGCMATLFLILILSVFDKIEDILVDQKKIRTLTIIFDSANLTSSRVINTMNDFDIHLKQPSITEDVENGITEIMINCKIDEDFSTRELFESIKALGYIKTIRIE